MLLENQQTTTGVPGPGGNQLTASRSTVAVVVVFFNGGGYPPLWPKRAATFEAPCDSREPCIWFH